jgi:hypothetical protein
MPRHEEPFENANANDCSTKNYEGNNAQSLGKPHDALALFQKGSWSPALPETQNVSISDTLL